MKAAKPRAIAAELAAISLAIALVVALVALSEALRGPFPDSGRPTPPAEAAGCRGYCRPAAAITLVSRVDRAAAEGIGEEQAPLAHRYAEGRSRSGNIDSPRGGGPSRLSHHSTSLYPVAALLAAANIARAEASSFPPTTVTWRGSVRSSSPARSSDPV